MSTYFVHIETWQTDEGWSAVQGFFGIEAERGADQDQAVDAVVGATLIALGHRSKPPRAVEFVVYVRERP